MERAREIFERIAEDESLILAVFSNPRKKSAAVRKVSLRPVLLKGELRYQAEYAYEKKVTHENLLPDARLFKEKCEQAGADLDYREYENMNHDFVVYPIPEANKAQNEIIPE